MTLISLIVLNVVFGSAVLGGIAYLLGHGIHRDRLHLRAELRELPRSDLDRIAA